MLNHLHFSQNMTGKQPTLSEQAVNLAGARGRGCRQGLADNAVVCFWVTLGVIWLTKLCSFCALIIEASFFMFIFYPCEQNLNVFSVASFVFVKKCKWLRPETSRLYLTSIYNFNFKTLFFKNLILCSRAII